MFINIDVIPVERIVTTKVQRPQTLLEGVADIIDKIDNYAKAKCFIDLIKAVYEYQGE